MKRKLTSVLLAFTLIFQVFAVGTLTASAKSSEFPEYEKIADIGYGSYQGNKLIEPYDIVVNDGLIYIANTKNASIMVLNESDNSYYGEINFKLGKDYSLSEPRRLAVFGDNLYVADMIDNCVKIYNKKTFAYIGTIADDSFGGVESVAASADYIFINDRFNYTIKVYDSETFDYIDSFGDFNDVHSIEVYNDILYVADYKGGNVYAYDVDSFEQIESYNISNVIDITFNDNTMYAIRPNYYSYSILDLETGDYDTFELESDKLYIFGASYSNGKLFMVERFYSLFAKLDLENDELNFINNRLCEPYSLAVDDEYLYVANSVLNNIMVYDKENFDEVKVISSIEGYGRLGEIRGITLFGENLYLADFYNDAVIIVNKNTFDLIDVITDDFNGVEDVAVTEEYIFVVDRFNDQIKVYDADDYSYIGSTHDSFYDVHNIAVYDDVLFVADYSDDIVYRYSAHDGMSLGTIDVDSPLAIAVDGDFLYTSDWNFITETNLEDETQTEFETICNRIFDIVVDGDTFYFADRFNNRIVAYKKSDSGLEYYNSIKSGEGSYEVDDVFGIAMDNDLIYLANSDEDEILIFDREKLTLVDKIDHHLDKCIGLSISNGMLYVTNDNTYYDDDWNVPPVSVFDLSDNSYVGYIDMAGDTGLDNIFGITVSNGKLYLVDRWNNVVYVLDEDDRTLIGTIGTPYENGDDENHLNEPSSVTVYDGLIYVLDRFNNKIKVYDEDTLDYVDSIYDDLHPMDRPFSCSINDGIIYVCDVRNNEIKAFDAETYEYIGTFLEDSDFDILRFTLFDDDKLYIVEGESKGLSVFQKLDSSGGDITDDILGTYTISGITIDGAQAGVSGSIDIVLNNPASQLISGDVRWIPKSANGIDFDTDPENTDEFSASFTFNQSGDQEVLIIFIKQVYFNSFAGWQNTTATGKTSASVTVTIDSSELTDLIASAEDILSSASIGDCNGQYSEAAVNALQNAINNAKEALINQQLSIEELDNALGALNDAIDTFNAAIIVLDTDELEDAIKQGEKIKKGNYTDKTWNNLQKAIADAKAVTEKEHFSQAELDNAVKAISDAIKALAENPKDEQPDTGSNNNQLSFMSLLTLISCGLAAISYRKAGTRIKTVK